MVQTIKPYPAYKDSGIEWLSEIPSGWDKTRLAYVGKFSKGRGIARKDLTKSGVPVILYGDIYTKYNIQTKYLKNFSSEEVTSNSEEIQYGDLLLTGSGETKEDIGKCVVYLGDHRAFAGGDIMILRPSGFNSVFVSYILNSPYLIREKAKLAKGEIVVHIYSSQLRNIPIPTPPLVEQTTIANFLDHKTAQIDAAIEKHRQLIELLQEHRAAIINEAVTRGLDDNGDLRQKPRCLPAEGWKDSGIEWIGEVPEHWEVKKLKWVHQTTSGGTPNTGNPEYYGGGIPWLRTLDLNLGKLFEYEISITELGLSNSSAKMIPINSVLVAMYGGAGTIGKSCLLKFKATINQAICAILPSDSTIPEFLHFFIIFYRPFWMIGAEGTRRDPNISQTDIRNMYFPIPPKSEQQEIIHFIESETTRIDKEINLAKKEIDLLEEYRQSLIAEAVTGKIDVRDYPLN